MATHSSILAWKIPWTGDGGGLLGITKNQTQLSTARYTKALQPLDLVFLLNGSASN